MSYYKVLMATLCGIQGRLRTRGGYSEDGRCHLGAVSTGREMALGAN